MTTNIPPRELKFGEVAVQKGLISEAQLIECLAIQKQLAEMGIHEAVGELLQKKGYIRPEQVGQILKAMGIDVSPVPGYQIQARLGQGGMGTVYKAKQVSMNRMVALKVLSPEMTKNKDFVERFLREARSAAQMNHKNIIQAFDAGVQNGIYYFAMEYINGHTVGELLKKKGRFSEKRALEIVGQIAEALEYLNHHGMVHRDIKPENIMVSIEGAVKLCDFGLVKQVQTDLSVTRSGFTFGTPYYMSPEQIQGKRLDTRADIYSLGTCLYKMLTGRHVFEGTDLQSVLTKHLTEKVPSPKASVPDLSDAACLILSKMLEKDRGYRYRNPRELVHDVRTVLAGGEPLFARQRRSSGVNLGVAVAVTALIVAFGLGAFFLIGGFGSAPSASNRPKPADPAAAAPKPAPPKPADPTPDPAKLRRETDAGKVKFDADACYEGKNWGRAYTLYQKLMIDPQLSTTDAVARHRTEIAARSTECKRRIAEIDERQHGTAMEREKTKRDEFFAAEEDYKKGQWREAKDRYDALAAKIPPEDLIERVNGRILECESEIQAEDEFAKLKSCAAQGNFELIEPLEKQYRDRFRSTATLGKVTFELKALAAQAATETQCKAAIAQARNLYRSSDLDGFLAMFAQIKKDFGTTDTFLRNREDLTRLGAEARTKLKAPREAAAASLLKEADAAFKESRAAKAVELYKKALSDHGESDAVAARRPDLENRIKTLEGTFRDAREKEAIALVKAAKAHVDRRNLAEAAKVLEVLERDYADTAAVAREQRTLKAIRDELARESSAFVIDMTDGPGEWERHGPTDRSIDPTDEGSAAGRKAAKLRFPGHEEGWSRIEHDVPKEGLNAALKQVNFRAKSGERFPVTVVLYLKMVEGKDEYYYMASRDIASGVWDMYKVALGEFKQYPLLGKPQSAKKLDPTKVRAIGFAHGPKQSPYEVLIDYLKVENK